MLLKSVTIDGFRSFRKRVQLPVSSRTTVLIGPNDHGKTNALLALARLNSDTPFVRTDVNDQRLKDPDSTYISYEFSLTSGEITQLRAAGMPETSGLTEQENVAAVQLLEWEKKLRHDPKIEVIIHPDKSPVGNLHDVPENLRPLVQAALTNMLPKVVLLTSATLRQLPDTVNAKGLVDNEVMQGVFRLAGIWDDRDELLSNNSRTNEETLRVASKTLTERIRLNWTQGADLEFHLAYVGTDIRLTAKDTAKTVSGVAERSDGFTAYFAMRMLLVARTQSASPNGFIFMFDEPGLNLHPKGQVDLQNVFEDIARTNQIVYSTHSVFLINKNYPDRNHLIFKDQGGSDIDNKPFAGGWAKVKEHLGLYLSSNFLFSDKVLLSEGTTDEIYVPIILQGLIERNRFDGDLNTFAIHSDLNQGEMIASASMFGREGRRVAALVDGDDEGDKRKQRIEQWKTRTKRDCPVMSLSDHKPAPCSIEDFLEPVAFREAVVNACKEALEIGVLKQPSSAQWEQELRTQMDSKEGKSLGKRVQDVVIATFGESISKVWIARKYVELLQQDRPELDAYWNNDVLKQLAQAVWTALLLPRRGDVKDIPLAATN